MANTPTDLPTDASTDAPINAPIEELLALSRQCVQAGDFDQAEQLLQAALASGAAADLASDNGLGCRVYYQLGLVLLKKGEPNLAMPAFREACERKASFALGHLHWGLALAQMGNFRGALGQYGQALKFNPDLTSGYYQSGVAQMALGDSSGAADSFAQMIRLEPNNGLAYEAMGRVCFLRQDYSKAIDAFAKALEVEPAMLAKERAVILNNWAVALAKQGFLEEALERLVQAVGVDGSLSSGHFNLGLLHLKLQEYELALPAFEKALQGDARVHFYKGLLFLLTKCYEDALSSFATVQSKGLSDSDLPFLIGCAYLGLTNLEDAKLHFEQALELNPSSYMAFDALGSCLSLMPQPLLEQSIGCFTRALELKPQFAMAFLHRGRSLEQLGQVDQAKEDYGQALQIDSNCLAFEKEALEQSLRGAYLDQAIDRALKLLDTNESDSDAELALAKALQGKGRLEEALIIVRALIEMPHKEMGLSDDQASSRAARACSLAGQILLTQGLPVEADEMFRKAVQLDSTEPEPYLWWGKALVALGLYEVALQQFAKAAQIDPYYGDAYECWGATLKALGRFSEAAAVFKTAADYLSDRPHS